VDVRGKQVIRITQQVVHAKISLPDGATFEDTASIGMTFLATGSATGLDLGDISTLIQNFFNTPAAGQTNPLANYISGDVSRDALACLITYTDVTAHLDGSNAGGPIATVPWTLSAATSTVSLPAQCAAVCSYRAAYGTDIEHGVSGPLPTPDRAVDEGAPATHIGTSRPRASDRGRFYLGPLNLETLASNFNAGDNVAGVLAPAFVSDLTHALTALVSTQQPVQPDQFNLVVWSRKNAIVKQIAYIALDAALAVIRKRADTVINRVLTWSNTGIT
jgi:hypothetical protein